MIAFRPARMLAAGLVVATLHATRVAAQAAADSTVITGTVVGADARVPVRADIALIPLRATTRVVRVRAAANGSFRLAIAGSGPFRMRATGVGYIGMERAIPVTAPAALTLAITLAGMPLGLAKGPLIGVASENDAQKPRPDMPPAVLLTPASSGRRRGALISKRDTVAYRVVDLTARLYLPPAGARAYRLAEDGEYEGLAIGRAGENVDLVYDSTLVAFGGASSLRVTNGHPVASVVAQLDSIVSFQPRTRCLIAAQATPIDPADATLRDSTLLAGLQLVRRFLRADGECQVHPALGALVVAQFTAGAPLWDLDDIMRRRVLLMAARHAAGQARIDTPQATALVRRAFDATLAAATDTTARFDLYVRAAELFMPSDTVSAQSYVARFVGESYSHPRLLPLLRLTGYNRVLQPGRLVPAFSVASADVGATISDTSLRGRVYLLDVWATWCPDCIVELPAMRALQQRFGARGLQIVSLSIDEQKATADRFRRREPMPWMHGWAGVWPDGEGPIARLEVAWLPTTILVGKDGRILSLAPKLESAAFGALVEQALK